MFSVRPIALAVVFILLSAASLMAQGGQSGGTGGSTGGTGSSRTTTSAPPRQPAQDRQPVFLGGRVVTEDGMPPPERVVIERVCGGMVRREGYSDSKGNFSIQLGENFGVIQDATTGSFDGAGMPTSLSRDASNDAFGTNSRDLMGCELRAALPGYRSESISLSGRRSLDHPSSGIIVVLHPYGPVQGTLISATSLQAPKDATKALEKAREYARKSKWEQAEQELNKAVQKVAPESAGTANARTQLANVERMLANTTKRTPPQ